MWVATGHDINTVDMKHSDHEINPMCVTSVQHISTDAGNTRILDWAGLRRLSASFNYHRFSMC